MAHKIERVMENTLVVGIDIAKRTHWAQMTDSRGVPLCKPLKVDNSSDGFSFLSERIKPLMHMGVVCGARKYSAIVGRRYHLMLLCNLYCKAVYKKCPNFRISTII